MKRKILFRSWDKEKKEMLYLRQVYSFADSNYSDTVELMQYTGLEDRKGKPIYEGDIVQTCYDFSEADQSRAQVVVEHLTCGIRWISPVHPDDVGLKPLYDPSGDPDDTGCLSWDLSRFEVVGNIYENPEMLH